MRGVIGRGVAAAAVASFVVLATATGASAVDGTIVNVERGGAELVVSVDVPPEVEVDLGGVTATVDSATYDATASLLADGATTVERTTVLAIDTSNSMEGARFDAAKAAATAFIDTVPDDVEIGIVTFDSDVTVELEPTTDRDVAREVISGLGLSKQTLLHDGVIDAVELTGTDGQRSVLVLSDGADTSDTPLSDVTAAVEDSDGVVVDVVALEQAAGALAALETIAETGEVISSDRAALTKTFSDEAEVLARQVAVSIDVPADALEGDVPLSITLPSSIGDVVASTTLIDIADDEPDADDGLGAIPVESASGGSAAGAPGWLIYAGVGIFAAGLLLGLLMLVPRRPVPMSAEERVSTYSVATYKPTPTKDEPDVALKQQASDAVAGVLSRNRNFEDRIATRLEGAGSELKPSEWLLVHAGVFVGISAVGLLLGGGNIVLGLIFMVLGVVGPWVYLGFRASRRRKAFDAALPETLQLMSGSLSAGLSLMQSVDTIVREGTEPVAPAFKRVLVETRIGVSLEDALDGVADRFDSRDFRWVVMAIKIQRQVGGNLAELLNTVAETMREREYVRRQVAALAAEGKLSAAVLGGLPPAFLLYLLIGQGDYVRVLFTDPRGIIMIVGAALWLGVGVFWMSKLVKVEV